MTRFKAMTEGSFAGVDGIKIVGIDRDLMQAMEEEAHAVGLPIAHHVSVLRQRLRLATCAKNA